MTPSDILALPPGPDLDRAVQTYVFNATGKVPAFSTDSTTGLRLLDRLPLFVGRVDPSHPHFDPSRPWIAGTLAYEATVKGDMTSLRVAAPTMLTALTKAALLFTLRPARTQRSGPQTSPEQAARAIAARIGTPAARNPNAAIPVRQDGQPRGKSGPKPRQLAGVPPARPQPSIFTNARDKRQPMPKRPESFQGPTPQPVAGGKMPV